MPAARGQKRVSLLTLHGLFGLALFFESFAFPFTARAQTIRGKATDSLLHGKYLYLQEIVNNRANLLDSAIIAKDGAFSFPDKKYPTGYYILSVSDTSRVDVILNPSEEALDLVFEKYILQEGVKIIASAENTLLWEYKLISKAVYGDMKQIYIEKSYLPLPPMNAADSHQLAFLLAKEDSLTAYKLAHLARLCAQAPATYFTRSVKPVLRKKYKNREEEKQHFFETVDFSDASLIRSQVFSSNIMDYLQKHTDYNEAGFKTSIDTILAKAHANAEVYDYCLNYLLELFERVGPDIIFQYLVEQYLIGEGCSEVNAGSKIKARAEGYRMLLPGNPAPDVALNMADGKQLNLHDITEGKKITLLFFWSSHCKFCHDEIPELLRLYKDYAAKGFEVVAISLDEQKADWEKFISENKLPWLNACDFKGWDSEAVARYKIHKTPGFYLVDHKKTIRSKPGNTETLRQEMAKYL